MDESVGRLPSGYTLNFSGTSLTLFGTCATPTFNARVDSGEVTQIWLRPEDTHGTVMAFYTSPHLEDSVHSVEFDFGSSDVALLDYATVGVGNRTSLDGKTMIVDENDPSIIYGGKWSKNSSSIWGNTPLNKRMPFGGSTSQVTDYTESATVVFVFNGTTFSVVGAPFDGAVILNFTLDDNESRLIAMDGILEATPAHNVLLSGSALGNVGEHKLLIEVIKGSAPIRLDYFTYTTTMPENASTTSSALPSNPAQMHAPQHSSPYRVIIGIVLATVVGFGIIALMLWFHRKRTYRHATSRGQIDPFLEPNDTFHDAEAHDKNLVSLNRHSQSMNMNSMTQTHYVPPSNTSTEALSYLQRFMGTIFRRPVAR
ncbi:hypothetical protein H0H87_009964, partial [Tephrocybe sp. NHM501043]